MGSFSSASKSVFVNSFNLWLKKSKTFKFFFSIFLLFTQHFVPVLFTSYHHFPCTDTCTHPLSHLFPPTHTRTHTRTLTYIHTHTLTHTHTHTHTHAHYLFCSLGPLSRFGDTAANALVANVLDILDPLGTVPVFLRTGIASGGTGCVVCVVCGMG